jgi:two-component system response regulator AlgR
MMKPLARDRLVRLLRDADECEVVGEAENGRDALQKVEMLRRLMSFC